MSSGRYDAIIVGAGIVGAACADECARQGMSVLVLDRDLVFHSDEIYNIR